MRAALALVLGVALAAGAWGRKGTRTAQAAAAGAQAKARCAPDNGGITLAAGFCGTVFADNIGHARHLAVAPGGVVTVTTTVAVVPEETTRTRGIKPAAWTRPCYGALRARTKSPLSAATNGAAVRVDRGVVRSAL